MILKILLVILLSLSLSSPAFSYSWCDHVDIEGCWLAETGSGLTLTDSSSNGNTGTFEASGEPSWTASVPASGDGFGGTSNYALDHDDSEYVDCGTGMNLTGNLTFVTWVNTTDAAAGAQNMYGSYLLSGSFDGFGFAMGGNVSSKLNFWSDAHGSWVNANTAFNDGNWNHVAGSLSSTTITFYIEGVADGTPTTAAPSSFAGTKMIGARTDGSAGYIGLLDEIALFSAAMDSTDINDIMDNGLFEAVSTRRIWFID